MATQPFCTRIKSNGEQCKSRAMIGLTVCEMHGGKLPTLRNKSERVKIENAMSKFVAKIDATDPENNPAVAFENEFRRTLGRIRYFDEKLAELSEAHLIWGQTKEESINATEFIGVNKTYEARTHLYHTMQWQEREHLMKMIKISITTKFDERKLALLEQDVIALDTVITNVLTKLGHNVRDPEVRNVMRTELLAIGVGK
jgi:hypothetical protein